MLITESQLNRAVSGINILQNMSYIEESYCPAMVLVTENSRLGANVTKLEDIIKLSECTGYNFDDCIDSVCESNNISPESIVLSVDEVSCYEDPRVLDICNETSIPVVVKQISDSDFVYRLTEAVIEETYNTGDMDFLLEFMGDDAERWATTKIAKLTGTKSDEAKRSLGTGIRIGTGTATTLAGGAAGAYLGSTLGFALGGVPGVALGYVGGALGFIPGYIKMTHDGELIEKAANQKNGAGILYDDEDRTEIRRMNNTIKNLASKPNSWAAKRLASLNKALGKWTIKFKNEPDPKKKGVLSKLVQTIGNAANVVKEKIKMVAKKAKNTVSR